MIIFVAAGALTLLLGPFMFAYLSRRSDTHKYPVGLADSIGDGFFLVLFNAYAFGYGFLHYLSANMALTLSLASVALIFAIGITVWRKDYSDFDDWSRPRKGYFNIGGYYHSIYLMVQSFIVVFSLFVFESPLLLLLFFGYLSTFLLNELVFKKK